MKQVEEIFRVLRSYGLRLTTARRAFVMLLVASRTPLSVSEILAALHAEKSSVDKTTVYRELERMQKLGIVESVQLGGRKRYYELASRAHHHHLVCVRCNQVEDVDMNEQVLLSQEQKARREKKFTVLRHSLEFFGLCGKCGIAA